MAKYRYEYEIVKSSLGGWGALGGNVYGIGDYRAVIERRAAAGWRYAGYIPAKQRGTGHIEQLDLIFEKEEG